MAVLHSEFSAQTIEESKISAADRKIRSYIENHGDIHYDAVIKDEPDWQIFYQLSELRKGVLNWYDFRPGSRVLEIGAAFGTLTRLLCERCAHVTATDRSLYRAQAIAVRYEKVDNLDVYAGDAGNMEFPEKFDYVIIIGLLERAGKGSLRPDPYVEYLNFAQKWLKPEGRLLFAVENRFGLRYFCGEVEPHTQRAFDGINRYIQGTPGRSFSRREAEELVKAAGFDEYRFYYPLPDYKLPQLVYTDECLPEKNIRERLIPYYRRSDTLVASERELYNDIIDNNVFPFFANSFLVECGWSRQKAAEEGRIVYAAVSTDRGEERGFATTVRADGQVRKTPLYKEGFGYVRKVYENTLELQARGIPMVEHRLLSEGALEMPYIAWPTLSGYIKEIVRHRPEELPKLLDQIYGYVLQASERVPQEENTLLAEPEACVIGKELFGPILKKVYMELIPLNCFYNPQTKAFLFFDQEFVRENCPAKYVLFRAIHYIYCFTPEAERHYPKQKLIQGYGLEETWEIYRQEENRFLYEVRNRDRYEQFYRRTQIDYGRMQDNAMRLGSH